MAKPKHFHKAPMPSAEDTLAKLEPYLRPVGYAVLGILIVVAGIAFWRSRVESRAANQWQQFSNAYYETALNRAPDAMSQFSERFPATSAGLAAEQIAGDMMLREGLAQQLQDKESAQRNLEGAKKRYQKIVDASTEKQGLMYERAVYSLAYALESLRQCDEAAQWYEKLTGSESSPFYELARRGIERCRMAQSVGFFDALDAIEAEVSGPAPGVGLPERPDITYPPADASDNTATPNESTPPAAATPQDPAPSPPGEPTPPKTNDGSSAPAKDGGV